MSPEIVHCLNCWKPTSIHNKKELLPKETPSDHAFHCEHCNEAHLYKRIALGYQLRKLGRRER